LGGGAGWEKPPSHRRREFAISEKLSPGAPEKVERRLAAVLSADAVGYTRLMAKDEVGTAKLLGSHREAMGGLIRQHAGRVVDAVGDNLLAEFGSVVDAVACAVEIQRVLQARNAELPTEARMLFRIGINLGDLIVEADRLAGDGINVAARLEGIAEPGGIVISGTAFDQVEGKLPLEFHDLGEKRLKNIPKPVRVYRVSVASYEFAPPVDGSAAAAGEGLTIPGFAGRHAIGVLPFDNLSHDPEQEYFADGITEDLITSLSASRFFPVIARNSTFVYKGKAVDVKQVSKELGVRYVVEGSVRKVGNRVRINAQLIDATSGHHIWAERYDRELSDIFALQDEIVETIVGSLGPALSRAEIRRAMRRAPEKLDAWDCARRALWHLSRYTKEDAIKAQSWLRRAIELHPDYSTAFSLLAITHIFEIIYRWSVSPEQSSADALRFAEKSFALDEEDPSALSALGFSCSLTGRYQRAIAILERAIHLNPSSALAHWALGAALTPAGRPDEAIPMIHKAIRLSPHDPWMHEFLFNLGAAHFLAERYEEAVTWGNRSLQLKPDQPGVYRLLAAGYGHLGQTEEARRALDALLRLMPDFSAAHLRFFLPPAIVERYLDGLHKAGWKE
jgi:TolB-like protein/class 3 adenylate cyclase/predicted Zn-dependent protease